MQIKIDERDLKVEYFDTAAKIEHVPTGIMVTEVSENSQHKNYQNARRILEARFINNKNIRISMSI